MREGATQGRAFFFPHYAATDARDLWLGFVTGSTNSAAALAIFAFHPGAAAMQLGQAAHQRQAQARAAGLAVEAIVHLVEGLEDLVELVARNAGAVVAHRDLEIAVARRGRPSPRCVRPPA